MAVLVAAVMALGLGACGGGDSDGDGADQQAADAGPRAAAEQAAPERSSDPAGEAAVSDAEGAYAAFIDYLNWESGGGACDRITSSFKRTVGAAGPRQNCLRRMEAIFSAPGTVKGKRKVLDVKVNGDKAILTVRSKTGATYKIPMANVGGQWQINGGQPWK
jgi:hypothetical protein